MREYLFLWICMLWALMGYSQEDEYYKVPEKRHKSHEIENLPNLDSKFSSFYVGVSGAFKKSYQASTPDFSSFGSNSNSFNDFLELNLGINFNNTYFAETGIVRLKNNLVTYVFPSPIIGGWGFGVGTDNKQYYVPLVVKRRVLSLNRITKNAYINVGFGGGILVGSAPKMVHNKVLELNGVLQNPDLSYFNVTLNGSPSPIYGEVSTEIKGNVTERLEILVFVKGLFRKSGYLSNSFEAVYLNGNKAVYHTVSEKGASVVFGLQARFNSRKFYRYSSKI